MLPADFRLQLSTSSMAYANCRQQLGGGGVMSCCRPNSHSILASWEHLPTTTTKQAPTSEGQLEASSRGSIRTARRKASNTLLAARKTGLTSPCQQTGAQNACAHDTQNRGSHIHMERNPQLFARHAHGVRCPPPHPPTPANPTDNKLALGLCF